MRIDTLFDRLTIVVLSTVQILHITYTAISGQIKNKSGILVYIAVTTIDEIVIFVKKIYMNFSLRKLIYSSKG